MFLPVLAGLLLARSLAGSDKPPAGDVGGDWSLLTLAPDIDLQPQFDTDVTTGGGDIGSVGADAIVPVVLGLVGAAIGVAWVVKRL